MIPKYRAPFGIDDRSVKLTGTSISRQQPSDTGSISEPRIQAGICTTLCDRRGLRIDAKVREACHWTIIRSDCCGSCSPTRFAARSHE